MERIGEGRRLVCCGRRGVGASQRDVTNISLEAQVSDLHAITTRLELDHFDMFASYEAASIAVTYADTYPGRISRLVLWAPIVKGSEAATPQVMSTLADFMRTNWTFARRAWADLCFPSDKGGRGRWFADLVNESIDPDMAAAYMEFVRDLDVKRTLARVSIPVLVFTRSRIQYLPAEAARGVAAALPNARFVSLDSDNGHPPLGDISYVDSIAAFLAEDRPIRDGVSRREADVLRLIVQGSSNREIAEALGISINTVERHVSNIYTKIGATNRAEAAAYAVRSGFA
jgi:DNA-binding NarL/FixJ family response regulator